MRAGLSGSGEVFYGDPKKVPLILGNSHIGFHVKEPGAILLDPDKYWRLGICNMILP